MEDGSKGVPVPLSSIVCLVFLLLETSHLLLLRLLSGQPEDVSFEPSFALCPSFEAVVPHPLQESFMDQLPNMSRDTTPQNFPA